jgi:sulfate transport system permease protein
MKAEPAAAKLPARRDRQDPLYVRVPLILAGFAIVGVLIVVPIVNVFYQALGQGLETYWHNLVDDPDTRSAIWLTLIVAPVSVAANLLFGIAAAWAVTRFQFRGRTLLVTLIDLPFAISPVVAGLMFVLLFGLQGYFGPWLREHGVRIIFALPGLILATTFVTLPFVARELIPVMEAIGPDEETAALSLGASGWQIFWRVTLPNIKWALLYGVILCNARAMGEFGAVYVVSGHIAGQTDTMPLRVQKLFDEYNNPGSFAVASLLTSLALLTLFAKVWLERKTRREMAAGARAGAIDLSANGPSALVEGAIAPGAIIPNALVGNVPIAGELVASDLVARVPLPHVAFASVPVAPVPVSREIP